MVYVKSIGPLASRKRNSPNTAERTCGRVPKWFTSRASASDGCSAGTPTCTRRFVGDKRTRTVDSFIHVVKGDEVPVGAVTSGFEA